MILLGSVIPIVPDVLLAKTVTYVSYALQSVCGNTIMQTTECWTCCHMACAPKMMRYSLFAHGRCTMTQTIRVLTRCVLIYSGCDRQCQCKRNGTREYVRTPCLRRCSNACSRMYCWIRSRAQCHRRTNSWSRICYAHRRCKGRECVCLVYRCGHHVRHHTQRLCWNLNINGRTRLAGTRQWQGQG